MDSSNQLPNINPDLAKERENCPFDLEEVTNLLDGGKEETETRRTFEKFLFSKIKVWWVSLIVIDTNTSISSNQIHLIAWKDTKILIGSEPYKLTSSGMP